MDHGPTLTHTTTHVRPVAALSQEAAVGTVCHHHTVTQMTRLDYGV